MNKEPETYEELIRQKRCIDLTKYYDLIKEQLEEIYDFLEKKEAKLKDLAQPIRIALTGSAVSPSIFEVLEFLGVDECKKRIENFLKVRGK